MNVIIEDESKKNNKLKILYIGILAICIISIIVAVVIQVTGEKDENSGKGSKLPELTDEQLGEYKEQFNNIFKNKVNYLENNSYKISKVETDKEIVYLGYQNNESKINDFELNVNIPYININNDIANEFNTQIKEIFEKKAKSILNSQNNNVIYTVDYGAYVSNNILSVVVRSTLKEGTNPQRDIVQTYNYDLSNQKKCTIEDMLELKGITQKEANQKIKEEIKKAQERDEKLEELGYTIYPRDYTSDMYSINNVTEYFMGEENSLYIVYAYGNENHTNQMDIVVM